MTKVDVFVKGPGSGRETAIRSLAATGLEILGIQDVTRSRTTDADRASGGASNGSTPPGHEAGEDEQTRRSRNG